MLAHDASKDAGSAVSSDWNTVFDRTPISLFRRLHQIATAVSAGVVEPENLVPLEFGTLLRIYGNPDVDQNTLAALLALDRTTISSLVFGLEKRGLIERAVNKKDRRARAVRLTRRGRAVVEKLRPVAAAAQQNILSVLSESERKQLVVMLQRVIAANSEHMRLGAGRRKPVRRSVITKRA